MSYQKDVREIAKDAVKQFPDDRQSRREQIDEAVSAYVAMESDQNLVIAESAAANFVAPTDYGFGYKHGLANDAMVDDIKDAVDALLVGENWL
jgi:hypothetical protein